MKTTQTIETIIEAGHDADDAPAILALCEHLECEPGELERESYDHYGLALYSLGNQQYAIGRDAEADSAVSDYIQGSIWAFNASFIISQCDLPSEMEEAIQAMQEKQCEDANDTLLALVEKCTTLPDFVSEAVSADGRGHFLSGYDGEENEAGDFYIYRVN